MKNWYLLIISLGAALGLFLMLALFYNQTAAHQLELDAPIQIILKSRESEPMDFWDVVDRGINEAAKEFGIEVEISGPRFEKEINEQIEIMNKTVWKNPPLIILAATDYVRLDDAIETAYKKNIPVINLDSGVKSERPVSFIATDNIAAGIKAGQEMARLLENHSQKTVAIVTHSSDTSTGIDREAGVRKALKDYSIMGTWSCEINEEIAYTITLDLLKEPELGGIVALNEAASVGVARGVEALNAADRVLVVGFDNSVEELSFLEEDVIKATVVQRPYNMGYLGVKTAVDYLSGRKVPTFIDTGSVLITRHNMFEREYQELLFPFNDQQ